MDSFKDIDLIKFFKFEQEKWETENLNTDYYFLYFPKNSKLSFDLNAKSNLAHIQKDSILIYVDSNSQINITDFLLNLHSCTFLIKSINIIIKENSTLEFIRDYDVPITIYSSINASIKSNSTLNLFYANSNVGKSFNEIKYQLLGENAAVNHVDLTALKNNAEFALTIYQEHKHASATSKVNSKVILKENAKSFYRGNIIIDEVAKNSQADQKQLSLILSSESKNCAIPSLQVKNNKVKCSHGAATGKIDEEQLWYLKSRGLDKNQAQNLIIEAFFSYSDVFDDALLSAILEKFKNYIK